MFLATTALSEFWDKDQEILILGAWCLRYDRRSEWEGLKYQVLPSPWADRKRFYDAALYLDKCGERMLDGLTEYLNEVHGLSKPQQYWRILLGPWLFRSLHVTYDRFVHLTEAFNRYPDLQTIVLDPRSFEVPGDTKEFHEFALDDPFNLQIFSQLLQGMGYAFPTKTFQNGWPEMGTGPAKEGWRSFVKRMAKSILIRIAASQWQVGLCDLGWSKSEILTLAWRSELRALPLPIKNEWSFQIGTHRFDDRRKNLAGLRFSDEFERLFIQSLPQNFPALYLGAFREAREETLSRAWLIPEVIASAESWYANEQFKFFAAEALERGRRLITMQVGGGYGIDRFSANELHEERVGDSFMVWGWADAGPGKYRNLPSAKLSSLITSRPVEPVGHKTKKILFVSSAHIRYLFRFHSRPIGIQDQEYFQWQLRFLAAIPDRVRRALLFRAYPEDYGHATREQISARFADVQWDNTSAFWPLLQDSQLAVIDHSGTTFLEALQLNVPTILYWDPHLTEVREEAESYFESLRKVGILWGSPEAAAKKVAEIYDEPRSWWDSEAVQEIRRRFVDRYALAREDWTDCWVKALAEEVAWSQASARQKC